MHLVADEGIERQIVACLRREGHDVIYIAEIDPGISDEQVLTQANEVGALLLTADKDFGELVYRLGRVTGGVLLLRLAGLSPETKANLVASTIAQHGDELVKAFSVTTPGGIRIRP